MLFAIDQQQYLQGYLPVVFAVLYVTNLNTVGNGAPVLTGPGIINKANAAKVAALAQAGHPLETAGGWAAARAARPAGSRMTTMTPSRSTSRSRAAGRAARRASASLARLLDAARHRRVHRRDRRLPRCSATTRAASTGSATRRSPPSWTDQAAQYGIVAVPVALLMIGGEFDLSAGVMIGSSGLLLGYLTTHAGHEHLAGDGRRARSSALAIGFLNGFTVVKTKLPSFIVTLATFFVLQGVNAAGTLKLTGDDGDPGHRRGERLRLGAPVLRLDDLTAVRLQGQGALVDRAHDRRARGCSRKTRFGNWIYGAGGDPTAARNVGVPSRGRRSLLFMMTSATAALMGIIEALELRSMQAKEGIGLEFIFIICAVVGGCLLTGGYGSVIGTFFGAAMLGMVQLGIIDAQWDSNWTYTFQGVILFARRAAEHGRSAAGRRGRDERATNGRTCSRSSTSRSTSATSSR